jgi:hypothetical protein
MTNDGSHGGADTLETSIPIAFISPYFTDNNLVNKSSSSSFILELLIIFIC